LGGRGRYILRLLLFFLFIPESLNEARAYNNEQIDEKFYIIIHNVLLYLHTEDGSPKTEDGSK
jgi:hypothetical protein